jgi:hypothetical protein
MDNFTLLAHSLDRQVGTGRTGESQMSEAEFKIRLLDTFRGSEEGSPTISK